MPYIIITTQHTTPAEDIVVDALESVGTRVVIGGKPIVSRTAVATLDEARATIQTDLCDWHNATGPDDPAIVATLDLTESGGTIGPLPDGTVIEVRPVKWADLPQAVIRDFNAGTR